MPIIFTPQTDEEIDLEMLLPEDWYKAQIIEAKEKISQAGNAGISLVLKVFAKDREYTIYDFILPNYKKKWKRACREANAIDAYEAGRISENDFLNKPNIWVYVAIEPERPNPKGGMYSTRNVITDYGKPDNIGNTPATTSATKELDDDIPF